VGGSSTIKHRCVTLLYSQMSIGEGGIQMTVVGGHAPQRRCSRGMSVARPVANARNAAFADMAAGSAAYQEFFTARCFIMWGSSFSDQFVHLSVVV